MNALRDFQRRWAESTSAPLRFPGQGRTEVPEEDYDRQILLEILDSKGVPAAARLGAYRLQYWFRLITLLQKDFPLVGHILGWEEFNPLAARYLRAHPPAEDLDRLGDLFPTWLRAQAPSTLAAEAARVDLAWNQAFSARELPTPSPTDLERLGSGEIGIVLQPAVRILSATRDWFPLRISLLQEQPVPGGSPKPLRSAWIVSRTGSVLRAEPVEPLLAVFLRDLRRRPWIDALERLAGRHPEATRSISGWFARGLGLGWWGVESA
jgi:hypothetical protein